MIVRRKKRRTVRKRSRDASTTYQAAHEHAVATTSKYGPTDKRSLEAWTIAADGAEEANDSFMADRIRRLNIQRYTGRGYGNGFSPPHGLTGKITLKDLTFRLDDFSNIRRSHGKVYGPYAGPGGIFYVRYVKSDDGYGGFLDMQEVVLDDDHKWESVYVRGGKPEDLTEVVAQAKKRALGKKGGYTDLAERGFAEGGNESLLQYWKRTDEKTTSRDRSRRRARRARSTRSVTRGRSSRRGR